VLQQLLRAASMGTEARVCPTGTRPPRPQGGLCADGAAPAPEPGGQRTHASAAIDTADEESAVQERGQIPLEVDVVIAGAGPVGATLALDLAQRGVQTLLLERSPTPRKLPKMERCNPRTMEIFRRLGVADTLREASAFTPVPMDVFVVAGFERPPLLHLRYPSVPEAKEIARNCADGSVPLEPQQLVSQYTPPSPSCAGRRWIQARCCRPAPNWSRSSRTPRA
jgi:hypothetical protein